MTSKLVETDAIFESTVSELADVLRFLMRAVVSDGHSNGVYKASEKLIMITDMLPKLKGTTSTFSLLYRAVEQVRAQIHGHYDDDYIETAKRGTAFLIETSSNDPAAKGRAGKRRSEFVEAMRLSLNG